MQSMCMELHLYGVQKQGNQAQVTEFRVVLTLGNKGVMTGAERVFWGVPVIFRVLIWVLVTHVFTW